MGLRETLSEIIVQEQLEAIALRRQIDAAFPPPEPHVGFISIAVVPLSQDANDFGGGCGGGASDCTHITMVYDDFTGGCGGGYTDTPKKFDI